MFIMGRYVKKSPGSKASLFDKSKKVFFKIKIILIVI